LRESKLFDKIKEMSVHFEHATAIYLIHMRRDYKKRIGG
jgi:hypothetical protein